MEIAQCINVKYIQSNSMIKQGKDKDIQCYLKTGYYKTQDRKNSRRWNKNIIQRSLREVINKHGIDKHYNY